MKHIFSKFFYGIFALVCAGLLTGCGNVVDEGTISVEKHILSGKYKDGYTAQGWHISPLHNFIAIDAREMVIPVVTDPKDKDGVALPLVKVEMRVRINDYNEIVPALRNNLRVEDTPQGKNFLGFSRLTSDGIIAVRQVSETMKAEEMFSDNDKLSKAIVAQYQKILNDTYPKLFTVRQVNVLKVDVPDFIQAKISSVAAKAAEIERNNASISSIASRKELQKKEAELIKDFMNSSGINAEQWVELEKIKMIREIYEESNSNSGSNPNQKDNKSNMPTIILNMSK